MAGISKNQRIKKEVDLKLPLEPRNWVASTKSSWIQFYIAGGKENELQALSIARKELEQPKASAEELKLTFKDYSII